jgi:hypothetical protein
MKAAIDSELLVLAENLTQPHHLVYCGLCVVLVINPGMKMPNHALSMDGALAPLTFGVRQSTSRIFRVISRFLSRMESERAPPVPRFVRFGEPPFP